MHSTSKHLSTHGILPGKPSAYNANLSQHCCSERNRSRRARDVEEDEDMADDEEDDELHTNSADFCSKCEHGRERSRCKELGGSSICEHGRHRRVCKECGGSGLCVHGRQKSKCKECGGSSFCEHGRRKRECKECGGSVLGGFIERRPCVSLLLVCCGCK